jgi:hypothetical protein
MQQMGRKIFANGSGGWEDVEHFRLLTGPVTGGKAVSA